MNIREYQRFAAKGILPATLEQEPIVAFALGLVGETGEVVDDIKKKIFHGRNIPIEHTAEELGDVMWYVANIANALNLDLETILAENVNKLTNRYPDIYQKTQDSVTFERSGPHIKMLRNGKFVKFISKEDMKKYELEQNNNGRTDNRAEENCFRSKTIDDELPF